MAYTNTYSNHTDDTQKRFPIDLTWSEELWDGYFPKEKAKGDVLKEMRQHAKAIEAQFNVIGGDPTYEDAPDTALAPGHKINASIVNAGQGLLTGINKFNEFPDVIPPNVADKIQSQMLIDTRDKLEVEANYSNYANINNTGYGRYTVDTYARLDNHTDSAYTAYDLGGYSKRGYYRCFHSDGWSNYFNGYSNAIYSQSAYGKSCYGRTGYWRYTNYARDVYSESGYAQAVYTDYNRNDTPSPTYTDSGLENPGTYQNTL